MLQERREATMKNLILVDGHSLAYRMFFALERTQMHNSQQFPTWGIYGFFKALFELIKDAEPDGMAIAFDMGRVTFRTEMYPEYKAHRKSMPDSLQLQMGKIREGVDLLGIPVFEVPNYEADDLIGTLARQAAEKGVSVTILTGDQDAFQIIDDYAQISVLLPGFKGGLSRYDKQKVYEKLGVYPDQVTDFKGLKGDSSDNIPGVPGIGDKTAAKLLAEYNTLEEILAHAEEVSGNKLRQSLIEYREQALLSKDLATIRYDAPVEFSQDSCHLRIPDIDDFLKFLAEMEFRTILNQSQTLLKPFLAHLTESASDHKVSLSNGGGQQQLQLVSVAPSNNSEAEQRSTTLQVTTPFPSEAQIQTLLPAYQAPFQIVKDKDTLVRFLDKIKQNRVYAIDIETSGLDFLTNTFAGIAMSWTPGLAVIQQTPQNVLGLSQFPTQIPILKADSKAMEHVETIYIPLDHRGCDDHLDTVEVLALLKPILEDPDIAQIAHNAKFETKTFRQHGIEIKGLIFDTMVASYVLNPDRRHGLKLLAYDILGHQMQDITQLIGTGKKQIPFTEVTLEDAAPYSACDAHITLELAAKFISQLDEGLTSLLYEVELPLVAVLAEMEYNGVSLDTDYLKMLSRQLEKQLEVLEEEIYEMAGVTFNLNSPKQVGEVLFDKLQIPARGMTPTKSGYTTNAKVIESLAPDYPIVQKLLDYRQLFKLKSTYIDALPALISEKDHRLHTSFNQTVTATGRLSSSDPNLQNIPIRSELGRSIRQAFVPKDRKQYAILSADYSQIELRLLAHFSEDPNLIEAFVSGEDIHKATAALVFDVPLDQVTKEMRYRAKAINFGIIYGQTAFGLSNVLKIPPKEAAEFIEKYFARYPKVKDFIERIKGEARATGKVKTIAGRVRDLSEGLSSSVKSIREFSERAAFNTPLQGSAADIMKTAMIRLFQALERENLNSKLILQVHDEIVMEVLEAESARIHELVQWAMGLDQPLRVPLEIDISTGPTWMEELE
jgi:DNA polymerase I